jgi:hypothetical protein
MQPLTSEGSSEDWRKAKANFLRVGNLFLGHLRDASKEELSVECGLEWLELQETVVRTRTFWGLLGTFLVKVYVIGEGNKNEGQHLDVKSALAVWSGLFNLTTQALQKSDEKDTRERPPARPHCTEEPCVCLACACCALPSEAGGRPLWTRATSYTSLTSSHTVVL